MLAWTILLSKKPFRIGDIIRIGEEQGEVLRIGTFFVTAQTLTDEQSHFKIPNKLFLEKSTLRFGKGVFTPTIKIGITEVSLDLDEKLDRIRAVIRKKISDPNPLNVRLDVEGNNWFIQISYRCSIAEQELRSSILIETYGILKEILKREKQGSSA